MCSRRLPWSGGVVFVFNQAASKQSYDYQNEDCTNDSTNNNYNTRVLQGVVVIVEGYLSVNVSLAETIVVFGVAVGKGKTNKSESLMLIVGVLS